MLFLYLQLCFDILLFILSEKRDTAYAAFQRGQPLRVSYALASSLGTRVLVKSIRRGRQVATIDRGAARSVGDEGPVTKELAEQLDVRRLAATGAGARVLEQRPQQLRALDRIGLELGAVKIGEAEEELVVLPLRGTQRKL